ncbi:hypothetical protein [Aliiroseovarius crassostreae]|uniref:hypothetical protein n=1 Tax=Aliiroseovarius crassostreae TaxID=154981 RepID=UPI003C79E269
MTQELSIAVVELKSEHRDAMLDLVLTWATIDGALSMLLANVRSKSWVDAADEIRKLRGSNKLAQVIRALKDLENGAEAARKLCKIKRRYEKHSKLRDHIAHSRCIGASEVDPNCIVFLTFERVGENRLAMYQVPVEEMREANSWGVDFVHLLYRLTRKE